MLAADFDAKTGVTLRPLRALEHRSSQLRNGISHCLGKAKRALHDTEAAELLEFALSVPLLVVMVVGIMDFAHAYNIKQKLTNAARAGARLGAAIPTKEISDPTPNSVNTIYQDVMSYLQDAGVDTSFIGTTMSYDPTTATATYYTSGNIGLKIERWVPVAVTGSSIPYVYATRVTLTYPYDWSYGFNHIINLLIPSANVSATIDLTSDAIMQNQGS